MTAVSEDTKPTVAVLGAGLLGGAIATRLAREGFGVSVWNRTTPKAEALENEGCTATDSVPEAVHAADVVLSVLADSAGTESVLLGASGVVEHAKPGAVVVQMGTVGEDSTARIAAEFSARGRALLDAPVSGSREPALAGELTVIASGDSRLRGAVEPVLAALARRIIWLERLGDGTRVKLAVNSWLAMTLEALAETVALCRAVDIDPRQMLDVLAGGPLDMPYAQSRGRAMIEEEFEPAAFPVQLLAKDADLALAAAESRESAPNLPSLQAVSEQAHAVVAAGHGEEDMTALFRATQPN